MPLLSGAGARFGVIGQVKTIAPAQTSAGGSSVAQQAFGDSSGTQPGSPRSGLAALLPTTEFGLAFWLRAAAFGFAWWVYYHLPE
jgi:hypothetical protein